nr:septation ring formation regulator EzrA [Sinobaca sp. H24]
MEFILLAILVIVVAVVIYGTLSRRKIYKDVDRLENWKIELGSRPVAEEIAKVKGLKISGETEEKFELWRKDWDDIVGVHIPDIEKALYDIEEQANKYRFGKARELIHAVENQLQDIEAQIDAIFKEVDELVHSEKENEAGITETQARYDAMSRHLLQHSLSFGKAAPVFEERKAEMKQALISFNEDREAGNYTSARQTLKQVDHDLEVQNQQMKEIPVLLKDIDMELPSELRELQRGVENMESQGYPLGHLSLHEQIEEYKQELPALKESCEEFELEKVKDRIEDIRKFMEATYEMLEKEVDAREGVQAEIPQLEEQLRKLKEKLADLQREEAKVEVSYLIQWKTKSSTTGWQ